jgi:hypothetical protein
VNGAWHELIHGRRWQRPTTLWIEDGAEYGWTQVDRLGSAVEAAIGAHWPARVVRIASGSKLGCFAGQLAAWRAGCVAVVDDGTLGAGELDRGGPTSAWPSRRSGPRPSRCSGGRMSGCRRIGFPARSSQ